MTSPDIFWFLPTSGDTRYLGRSDFGRAPTNAYMREIAVTAERLGYDGLLIPTGSSCQDPWVTAASLIGATSSLMRCVSVIRLAAVTQGSWQLAPVGISSPS